MCLWRTGFARWARSPTSGWRWRWPWWCARCGAGRCAWTCRRLRGLWAPTSCRGRSVWHGWRRCAPARCSVRRRCCISTPTGCSTWIGIGSRRSRCATTCWRCWCASRQSSCPLPRKRVGYAPTSGRYPHPTCGRVPPPNDFFRLGSKSSARRPKSRCHKRSRCSRAVPGPARRPRSRGCWR